MISNNEIGAPMSRPWLFVLEDTETRIARMTRVVEDAWGSGSWEQVSDAGIAVSRLGMLYDGLRVISLDHDLFAAETGKDRGVGMDVVLWLEHRRPTARIIIHSANGPAAAEMFNRLQRVGFTVCRVFPMKDDSWIESDWMTEVKRLKEFP